MSLSGKRIVFSGFNNHLLKLAIEKQGGKVLSSISKLTNIVVTNDLKGTSIIKTRAHEFRIPVIDVTTFMSMFFKKRTKGGSAIINVDYQAQIYEIQVSETDNETMLENTDLAAIQLMIKKACEKHKYPLRHGDLIISSEAERFIPSYFVVRNTDSKATYPWIFVNNPDTSGSGYLSIPLEVSEQVNDVMFLYDDILHSNDSESIKSIAIGPQDILIQKTFTNPLKYPSLKYTIYDYDGEWMFVAEYDSTHDVLLPLKTLSQKQVEDALTMQLSPSKKTTKPERQCVISIVPNTRIDFTIQYDGGENISGVLDTNVIEQVIHNFVPSNGKWKIKQHGKNFMLSGPSSESQQVLNNLRIWYLRK